MFLCLKAFNAAAMKLSSARIRHAAASSAAKFTSRATASGSCSLLRASCNAKDGCGDVRIKDDLTGGSSVMWYSNFRATL